jgi:hypothetical protein
MRILIVESNQRHIDDALKFFSQHPDVQVEIVRSLLELNTDPWNPRGIWDMSRLAYLNQDCGVIAAVDMPLMPGAPLTQCGLSVKILCRELGVPCVPVIDGPGDDPRYAWISIMHGVFLEHQSRQRNASTQPQIKSGFRLVPGINGGQKNWEWAFNLVSAQLRNKAASA